MRLERLEIRNFRNIGHAVIEPDPSLTLWVGKNGQGKTNALEALYLLCQARSFRTAGEEDWMPANSEGLDLKAEFRQTDGGEGLVRLHHQVTREPRRRKHEGPRIPVVLFSPDDLAIVKGGPADRRKFLDELLSTLSLRYQKTLMRYRRIVLQRNRALKEGQFQSVVENFSELLVTDGWHLWQERQEVLNQLYPLVLRFHREMGPGERLQMTLDHGGTAMAIAGPEQFRRELTRRWPEEKARGVTLVGPHRDDVRFELNERPTQQFASQGQQRTLALALRLATHDLLERAFDQRPLVLLDDVLSELDGDRRSVLLRLIDQTDQQTIVTDTEARNYDTLNPRIYEVRVGEFARRRESAS